MDNRLIKKVMGLACILFLGLISTLNAEQQVSVAIFPFSIQASGPNQKIQESLPLMLKEKLEKDGARVVFVQDYSDKQEWDYQRFRQEGIKLGVDHIITGNLFVEGERVSLDAQMRNTYENVPPLTFFSQAESTEGLALAVTDLSRGLVGELFEKRIIANISIAGNRRVESDAIARVIVSKPGEIIDPEKLSKDLTLVYKMGFFDNVTVNRKKLDQGVEIIFEVKEKPSVRKIKFEDNNVYETEELFDVVDTSTGSILNVYKINSDVEKLKRLYTEKNYHNCKITYDIKTLENNQADIIFKLDEGKKLKVESISFEGNQFFDDDDLKDEMKNQEKGFWSFLSSSGDLNEAELDNDVVRIESLYKNNGFINVKVSDPKIDLGTDKISVSFKINEGHQYKVGQVAIAGDILTTKQELLEKILSKKSELYNREHIRKDLMALNDLYSNQGYANVNVAPLIDRDDKNKVVNISFKIDKGELVYFNRIIITGNTKTRDKVIRREIAVEEQGRFSMSGIQRSYRNLGYKDYFQTLDIRPVKTDEPNKRDLEVKVSEKATGNFSFGGGFSSDDGAFGQVSLEERNLFGKGQNLKLMARISGTTGLYNISFTEPWLYDKPISAGFDIYKLEKEYDYYDRDSIGLTLRTGFRQIWDYTAIGVEYNVESFEVSDVDANNTAVKAGDFFTSSITPYIKYDSRNHYFLPTEGSFHKFSVEYAGEYLGGDIDYSKILAETGWWIPLFWKFTGAIHAKGGYLDDRTGDDIDIDWERFYLGGINSIRGFDDTDDINGQKPGDRFLRGGEKFLQFNLELIFPIEQEMGVAGVLFYDRGDVYTKSENINLADQFSSVGFELRWNSPMGPIRLAYGIVMEGQDKKTTGDGQFDFSIGAFF